MAVRLPTRSVNAGADAIAGLVDAGTGPGLLRIYTGTQPASANGSPSGTLLAEFELDDPAFAAADGGITLMTLPDPTTGIAAGTAGWARLVDSDEATVADGSVTGAGGGGDITMNTTTVSVGLTLAVTAFYIQIPTGE